MLGECTAKYVDNNNLQNHHQFNEIMTLMQLKNHGNVKPSAHVVSLSSSSSISSSNDQVATNDLDRSNITVQKSNSNDQNENQPSLISNNQKTLLSSNANIKTSKSTSSLFQSLNRDSREASSVSSRFDASTMQGPKNFEMKNSHNERDISSSPSLENVTAMANDGVRRLQYLKQLRRQVNLTNDLHAKNIHNTQPQQIQMHQHNQSFSKNGVQISSQRGPMNIQSHVMRREESMFNPLIQKESNHQQHYNQHQPTNNARTNYRMHEMLQSNRSTANSAAFTQTQDKPNKPTPPTSSTGCTCKKSKCLKLYCQCFASSQLCGDKCVCTACENKVGNEKAIEAAKNVILERNPRAFEAKFKKEAGGNGNGRASGSISLIHPLAMTPNQRLGADAFMRRDMPLQSNVNRNWNDSIQSNNLQRMQGMRNVSHLRNDQGLYPTQMNRRQQHLGIQSMLSNNMSDYQIDPYSSARGIANRQSSSASISRVVSSGSPPASDKPVISHSLGCRCRKSFCLKKYCECYQNDVKCGINCKCINCKNQPDEVIKDLLRRRTNDMTFIPREQNEYLYNGEVDRASLHPPLYSNPTRPQDVKNASNPPSQYPVQEYRPAINQHRKEELVESNKPNLKEDETDKMEIMAALAMTQLSNAPTNVPGSPKQNKVPRPVSSTPETAMGQNSNSQESYNSNAHASESNEASQKRAPSNDGEDGWLPQMKRRKLATSNHSLPPRNKNEGLEQKPLVALQQARRLVSIPQDDDKNTNSSAIPIRKRPVQNGTLNEVNLQSFRIIGKLPPPLTYRKICSRCGKTRSEHGELGFGNKCVFQDCGRCGAGIQVHNKANKFMGFLCTLSIEEGATPGMAERYDKNICSLATMAELKRDALKQRKDSK